MDRVKSMFNEVKMELLKVALIYSFLDSIMLFFVLYFLISFFNIAFIYTLAVPGVITLAFFAWSMSRRIGNSRMKDMEDANPQLKEMLRTAHDNMDQDSPLLEALFLEVRGKLQTASSGNLLESKKIMLRIVSAVVIVFLIVIFSSIQLNLQKIDIPLGGFNFMKNDGERTEGQLTELVFNETDVIYGDSQIAKLGNELVNIKVNPSISDIDFNDARDAEDRELREGSLPSEIGISPDAFNNQKALEEAEQAANYSQRIRNI